LKHEDGLQLHVSAMCGMLAGYGAVALEHFPVLPCGSPVGDVFAGLLDPGLEHLPPLSYQLFVW